MVAIAAMIITRTTPNPYAHLSVDETPYRRERRNCPIAAEITTPPTMPASTKKNVFVNTLLNGEPFGNRTIGTVADQQQPGRYLLAHTVEDLDQHPMHSERFEVSRTPEKKGGSHVLAYADKAGGTEENALYGTPDDICAMLEALQKAGVAYVLLTISGGSAQLRRFAREIMPVFAQSAAAADAAE